MRLEKLKIGRRIYQVIYQYLPKDHGRINFSSATIRIDDPQEPLTRVDATLHEILHGIWLAQKLPDRCGEERAVTALGNGLAATFRDNPGLLLHFEKLLRDAR